MDSWHSYPKVYAIGHAALKELLFDEVIIQEKVDGSQFSFGRFDGELKVKSKGKEMMADAPEKMFTAAVDTAKSLDLKDGWTYRGEYLSKPKHNALAYDRVPKGNIIIFDINIAEEEYLRYNEVKAECDKLGLETVPLLKAGRIGSINQLISLLEITSILGGQKIEGFVIKNYRRFGPDKKVLMGKYVSEAFKEVHKVSWKDANPKQGDIIQRIIDTYKTDSRWNKAVQHLKEKGGLEGSPRDIGKLILEAKEDIKAECVEEIKETLFKWGIDNILRGCVSGLPQWYKEELLKQQFTGE